GGHRGPPIQCSVGLYSDSIYLVSQLSNGADCQVTRTGPVAMSSVGDVVESVGVGTRASRFAAVQAGDGVQFVAGEAEVEDVEVRLHPLTVHRLREHDVAALDVPAQHHLRRSFAMHI